MNSLAFVKHQDIPSQICLTAYSGTLKPNRVRDVRNFVNIPTKKSYHQKYLTKI